MFKPFCNLCDKANPPDTMTIDKTLLAYRVNVSVTFQPLRHGSAFHICDACKLALLERLIECLKGD